MSRLPFFKLFVDDFLGGIILLSREEVGSYILLLCYQWNKGAIPDNEQHIRRIGQMEESDDISWVYEKFPKTNNGLQNLRMENERVKIQLFSDKQREKAGKRWESPGNATAIPQQSRGIASHSHSHSHNHSQSHLPQAIGQNQSHNQKPKNKKRVTVGVKKFPTVPSKSGETWEAYKTAYQSRYAVDPVRNAQVNALLSQLVDRVGQENSPKVAEFYVSHNAAWYVSRGHSVKQLVSDAEKLHMEMQRGQTITRGDAKNAEHKEEHRNQVQRVADLIKGGLHGQRPVKNVN